MCVRERKGGQGRGRNLHESRPPMRAKRGKGEKGTTHFLKIGQGGMCAQAARLSKMLFVYESLCFVCLGLLDEKRGIILPLNFHGT